MKFTYNVHSKIGLKLIKDVRAIYKYIASLKRLMWVL